jgi:amino acid adenylation domain-containing protein
MSKQNIEDIYPLSPAQQGMLLYLVLAGYRSEVYFDQYVATLGALDPAVLRRAWQRVLDRHPALRTLFLWEKQDQPVQVVRREVELPWQEHDWRDLPAAAREERFAAFLRDDHARGFDLGKAPLTRVALVRWAEEEWRLVWSFSHLILDGWSIAVVLSELQAIYAAGCAGRDPELPAPRPYRDYIAWLRRQDPARAEEHWRRALAGFEPPTPLPFDGTGAPRDSGWAAAEEVRALPPATMPAVQALVRRHQITVNVLFQGLWGLLLGRWRTVDDVVYGGVVSGRPYELDGVESMVGMFINALPVRLRVDAASELIPWLQRLQTEQSEQRELEYCSNEQILVWTGLPRHMPLYESLLVFENYPADPLGRSRTPGGLDVGPAHLAEANNFPLTLYVIPRGLSLTLKLSYHWDRFGAEAAQRILDGLESLLDAVLEKPESRLGDLPLVRPEQRAELIAAAAGPHRGPAGLPVHRQFQRQAAVTPDAPAVISALRTLTYGELDLASRFLAARLRDLGIGPESIVGLCAERSPEMIVGLLAILEAGGAYLPLDPAYPPERLAYMLRDSGARLLLAQERLLAKLPAVGTEVVLLDGAATPGMSEEAPPPADDFDLDRLAYVIYTSGSTGRPKGVLVPHAALAHYAEVATAAFGISHADRVLQFASISFDTSGEEIYPCLIRGAALVLRDDEMVASLDRFAREAGTLGVSVLDLPTAYWHELVAEMEQGLAMPAALRLVILGGEQARRDRLEAWRERAGNRIRLINTYGPTEATIVSTRRELTSAAAADFAGEVPIGRPIEDARAYVAGPGQELLPPGLDGELLLGGAGLTRGYLGRPDLTAERFVPDPYSGEAGARLYRTGDLVRLRPGGDLEFRGRTDQQVKVRGYRIELGEVESALRDLPAVRDAVVVAQEARGGGKRLVAWIVPLEGQEPTAGELRGALQDALPEYMVPAAFAFLAELPVTPGGKVDRRAVARMEAEETRPDLGIDFAAPRSQVEEMLVEIWRDLLGMEKIGVHDDFFQLGGHSLLVAKLASRVRQAFHVELPMVEVFKTPTVADLAAAVERAERAEEVPELPPISRAPRDRPLPLSFPQERVWFLDQLSGGSNIAYNFQVTIWFRGALDVAALHATLEEIVRRHEILRTTFPAVDGRPVQVIHSAASVALPIVDLRGVPEEERQAAAERLVAEATQVPFAVTRLPLIRWTLLRLADDLHELIQVEYHFVHDGWSFAVMLREIKAIYTALAAGEPSPLPELPVQYADFAVWQRSWMESEVMDHMLGYWRRKLAGSPTALELPTDRPRPVRPSFAGELRLLRIPPELYQELRDFSRRQRVTLFMSMLAGYYALLHRYTGQEDVLVGTTNANRRLREIEGMIGMVVNSLVLRGDLAGDPTFAELLARVRDMTIETQLYQDTPLERLVQELRPERQLSRNPLFQVMFHFHDAGVPDLDFAGLKCGFLVRGNRTSKMDLNVIVIPRAEQRVGLGTASAEDLRALLHWEYNTDLFDAATMERMIACYLNLLAAAARNPGLRISELPLLDAAEQAAVAATGNDTAAGIPARLVHQLVEETAAARPGTVAVGFAGATVTYAELNAQANRLAHRLRRLGVGPESRVAVCLERSPALVTALLGVLKSGGAYVPLDPGYPADRLAWVLEDSRAAVLITQSSLLPSLPAHGAHKLALDEVDLAGESAADPVPLAGAENPAYVIYTSGSTGRPKGVVVRQRGVVNFLASMARRPGLEPDDVLLAVTTISFDIAVLELFLPLIAGARVELADRETVVDGRRLAARIAGSGVTMMQATPATWRLLMETGWQGSPALKVLCGGEALPPELARELLGRVGSLWNVYGPTETTVWSAAHPVSREDVENGRPVPLGGALANTEIYLLDRFAGSFEPTPDGVPGELYIGGEGLARGYFGRPDLTAERFVPDPFAARSARPGSRLYCTGDLVRRRPRDGALEFLGRADFQVKIRGFRIELGEVESVLATYPGVRECAAVAREDRPGDRRLVAYLVTADGAPKPRELRAFLAQRLPEYMVPSDFVTLERLPLSPAGKVDRRALPSPDPSRPEDEVAYVAPRTPAEETLAAIWAEVLGLERVGVCDDFFALGGHSLSAARVLARVRDAFGVELPLSLVFEKRTIEGMTPAITAGQAAQAPLEPLLEDLGEADLLARAAALSDADLDALLRETLARSGQS